jgi:hypothetical protein
MGTDYKSAPAGVNDAYWGHGGGKQYQIMDWDNLIQNADVKFWFSKEGVKL